MVLVFTHFTFNMFSIMHKRIRSQSVFVRLNCPFGKNWLQNEKVRNQQLLKIKIMDTFLGEEKMCLRKEKGNM